VVGQRHVPADLLPKNITGTNFIEGLWKCYGRMGKKDFHFVGVVSIVIVVEVVEVVVVVVVVVVIVVVAVVQVVVLVGLLVVVLNQLIACTQMALLVTEF
jgi:hypothetical protein